MNGAFFSRIVYFHLTVAVCCTKGCSVIRNMCRVYLFLSVFVTLFPAPAAIGENANESGEKRKAREAGDLITNSKNPGAQRCHLAR